MIHVVRFPVRVSSPIRQDQTQWAPARESTHELAFDVEAATPEQAASFLVQRIAGTTWATTEESPVHPHEPTIARYSRELFAQAGEGAYTDEAATDKIRLGVAVTLLRQLTTRDANADVGTARAFVEMMDSVEARKP